MKISAEFFDLPMLVVFVSTGAFILAIERRTLLGLGLEKEATYAGVIGWIYSAMMILLWLVLRAGIS